jgi:thioesterase domain-containing protein
VDTTELQQFLHQHIPLSQAMRVEVLAATAEGVKLSAPLAPNINHRDTVFGGSAAALAILSAWSLLHIRLQEENLRSRIVIHKSTMNYDRPITEAFTASSVIPDATSWLKFMSTLKRKQRARIWVAAGLYCKEETVGKFEGEFVALLVQDRSNLTRNGS